MIRYFLIAILLTPTFAHPGTFYFPGSSKPYPAQSEDDEEVVEDYSWMKNFRKPSPPRSPVRTPRRHYEEERRTESRPPCPGCGRARPAPQPLPTGTRVVSTTENMRKPIWASFARNFAICAPGCQPAGIGIHREHDGTTSCHHVDRAIDVGAMICNGQIYRAINGGRFSQMVACMRPRIRTLYQQSYKLSGRRVTRSLLTQAHYDHAHFSIGCYGGSYY